MFKDLDLSKMGELFLDVQKKAQEIESEVSNKEFEAKSGGGLVSAKVNGQSKLLDINIDDSLLEDKESLQILLISAINDALQKASEEKMSATTTALGGLNFR